MSSMIIKSREANDLKLTAYHGHFATRHSHNSHYLDITRMKHECAMANIAAASLANHYVYEKEIDTVVCLDGSGHRYVSRPPALRRISFPEQRKKYLRRRTGARFQRTSDLPG